MAEIEDVTASDFEMRIFKEHAEGLYRSMSRSFYSDTSTGSGWRQCNWLAFAIYVNPRAALQFQRLAEAAEAMQGLHGDFIEGKPWHDDPLTYLEDVEFKIPRQASEILKGWETELRQNHIGMEMRQYEVEFNTLYKAYVRFCRILPILEGYLHERYFDTSNESGRSVNPFPAFRAATHISEELGVILPELKQFVANIQTNAPSVQALQDAAKQANLNSPQDGLRRRKPEAQRSRNDSAIDVRHDESHRSGEGPTVDPTQSTGKTEDSWLAALMADSHAASLYDKMSVIKRLPWKLRNINQPALIALSLLVSCISGVLLGVGLMQSRPADCVPRPQARDDGFYALIAQLLLQVLSLYCTVIPLTRDKAVSVSKPLFGTTLASSAAAAIVAPIVYGFSWRISMMASFFSGFAALMASVQLAGGVQEFQRGLG